MGFFDDLLSNTLSWFDDYFFNIFCNEKNKKSTRIKALLIGSIVGLLFTIYVLNATRLNILILPIVIISILFDIYLFIEFFRK